MRPAKAVCGNWGWRYRYAQRQQRPRAQGYRDDGVSHTIWISTNTFNAIKQYSGTNMSTCPSLAGTFQYYRYPYGWVIGYNYTGGHRKPWAGEPARAGSRRSGSPMTRPSSWRATSTPGREPSGGQGWVIAPHCRGGAAKQAGVPFLWVTKLTKPQDLKAQGGNVLLLTGSVHWRNIRVMTNYWAFEAGTYWNAW